MTKRELFLARLAEIAREYELPLRGKELAQSRLRWEDWETLRHEAAAFALRDLKRWGVRGARTGLLPGGLDAEDIADQAIAEVLGGRCRLPVGFTKSLVSKELRRLTKQRIRQLYARAEGSATRSEWELASAKDGEERESIFEQMPGGGASGFEAAAERDESRRRKDFRRDFEHVLSREPELLQVFRSLCAGVTKPGEIARRVGMEEKSVVNARKRLERRVAEFGRKRALEIEA